MTAPTIADGIAVKRPGELNLSIIRKWVDEVVAVDEETIAGAVLDLFDKSQHRGRGRRGRASCGPDGREVRFKGQSATSSSSAAATSKSIPWTGSCTEDPSAWAG